MNGWALPSILWPGFRRNSVFCGHRMNKRALPFILWPGFRRNSVFCGHRMDRWALPFILWPGGQGWRSFLPAGAEENFFWGPGCFPAEPRTTSIFLIMAAGGRGAGEGLGWGYFPSSSRSSGGGSCCYPRITPPDLLAQTVPQKLPPDLPAQTVPKKTPAGPASPNCPAGKPRKTCQPKLSRRKSLHGFLQCALGSVTWQVRKFHESWVNWNSPYLY